MDKEKKWNLSDISTCSQDIKGLMKTQGYSYEEAWTRFYHRYHTAIIRYILKKTGWKTARINDAEEIASLVYEKGMRWNFDRLQGVKFRVVLKRMVRDVLRDYYRRHNHNLEFNDKFPENHTLDNPWDIDTLSTNIFESVIENILESYPEKEKNVLKAIAKNKATWPRSEELADILQISGENISRRQTAARQWKHNHKDIWKNFQNRLIEEIEQLAWDQQSRQEELEYFKKLNAEI